jgi:hypothetical protein
MSLQSLQLVNTFYNQVTGRNGAGSISVPGVDVGDVLLVFLNGNPPYGGLDIGSASPFENVISVADQVQQIATNNFSASSYNVFFLRIQS